MSASESDHVGVRSHCLYDCTTRGQKRFGSTPAITAVIIPTLRVISTDASAKRKSTTVCMNMPTRTAVGIAALRVIRGRNNAITPSPDASWSTSVSTSESVVVIAHAHTL